MSELDTVGGEVEVVVVDSTDLPRAPLWISPRGKRGPNGIAACDQRPRADITIETAVVREAVTDAMPPRDPHVISLRPVDGVRTLDEDSPDKLGGHQTGPSMIIPHRKKREPIKRTTCPAMKFANEALKTLKTTDV